MPGCHCTYELACHLYANIVLFEDGDQGGFWLDGWERCRDVELVRDDGEYLGENGGLGVLGHMGDVNGDVFFHECLVLGLWEDRGDCLVVQVEQGWVDTLVGSKLPLLYYLLF